MRSEKGELLRTTRSLIFWRDFWLIAFVICQSGCGASNPARSGNDSILETNNVKEIKSGPVNYVALGDSTGAGVGALDGGYVSRLFKRIEIERPGSTLANLCVSGATTEDVIGDQLDRGIAKRPTLVTLGIGINDVGHGFAIEQFGRQYATILERLTSETDAVIVVTNIPDISSAPRIPNALRAEYQARIIQFNRKLEEVAGQYEVMMFDVYSVTHEQLPDHPEFFSADGFHPSDPGYENWAEQMWPAIARILGAETK
jgi:lysophospholipase L1-like esterase